jgi:hypothetical protein
MEDRKDKELRKPRAKKKSEETELDEVALDDFTREARERRGN